MIDRRTFFVLSLLIALAALCLDLPRPATAGRMSSQQPESPKAKPVDFRKQIQPIFSKHCYSCHGAKKQESGFRLDRKDDALNGGERGQSIIPGNSKKSLLYQYVAGLDPDIVMPPEDETLSKAQIALIKRWIDEGADWPDKK